VQNCYRGISVRICNLEWRREGRQLPGTRV